MIPGFNERGHLPSGLHKTNIEDFKTRFVDDVPDSETRPEIFSGYKNYCNDLLKLDITMKQWLDGGFTTNKINPNDLDVVSHVDALKINNNKYTLDQFRRLFIDKTHSNRVRLNSKYKCDPFAITIYPPGHKYYDFSLRDIKYWSDWFGHDTRISGKPSKGLIELDLKNVKFKLDDKGV